MNSFVFYASYYEAIKELNDTAKLEMFNAICEYALNDKLVELDGISKAIFNLVKPNLDSSISRYKASVSNGKKGRQT